MAGYNLGDPPSLNSEFTTGFPTSKYMYKLVFALSETFTRPLHDALFTPTAGLQDPAHTSASEQSRLRPWPSAAIWRACGATLGLIMKPAVMADRHAVRGQSHDPIFDDVALLDISLCTR